MSLVAKFASDHVEGWFTAVLELADTSHYSKVCLEHVRQAQVTPPAIHLLQGLSRTCVTVICHCFVCCVKLPEQAQTYSTRPVHEEQDSVHR